MNALPPASAAVGVGAASVSEWATVGFGVILGVGVGAESGLGSGAALPGWATLRLGDWARARRQ